MVGQNYLHLVVNNFFISENVSSINVLADSPRCWAWCKSNHHPDQPAERKCSHTEHLQCQVVILLYARTVSCTYMKPEVWMSTKELAREI